jgi:hypothetical protein
MSNDVRDDFNEFFSAQEVPPPKILQETIFARVHDDLFPSFQRVFLKVLGVHALVSLFSLSICSQFGIQLFHIADAMNTFMDVVGHAYCMFFCGALYLGLSALVLGMILKPEDVRAIRRHRLLQFSLLAGISMGVFLCVGAEILLLPGILWFAGSMLSSALALELGWNVRSSMRATS